MVTSSLHRKWAKINRRSKFQYQIKVILANLYDDYVIARVKSFNSFTAFLQENLLKLSRIVHGSFLCLYLQKYFDRTSMELIHRQFKSPHFVCTFFGFVNALPLPILLILCHLYEDKYFFFLLAVFFMERDGDCSRIL